MNKVFFALCLLPFFVFGQTDYKPLTNTGAIPYDFFAFKDASRITTDNHDSVVSAKDLKLFRNFQTGNNYFLHKLLNGGSILYSGPLYEYVNKVADSLLVKDPELRKEIRIFITLSSSVNAFALNNGYIFINLGLIAHMQNEAQLAYIIAHEISHYTQKHSFKEYKKVSDIVKKSNKKLEEELGIYNENDFDLLINHYSRTQESEADLTGLSLFAASSYQQQQAVHALDQLNYASYAFENKTIDKSFLEYDCLRIPKRYFPDTSSALTIDEDDEDTLSSHPNTGKRKQAVSSLLDANATKGKLFAVSEYDFYILRDVCRFELSRLLLFENDYVGSIYNSFLLLQNAQGSSASPYLNACIAKSIYFIQDAANQGRIHSIVQNPKRIKGEPQKLHYLLNKVSKDELNAICLANAWKIKTRCPQGEEVAIFTDLILQEFVTNVSSDRSYFLKESVYQDSLLTAFYNEDTAGVSRKLYTGQKTERKKIIKKMSFAPYSLCNTSNDPQFIAKFDSLAMIAKGQQLAEAEPEETQRTAKKSRKPSAKNQPTRINRLIVIDISHYKYDLRKDEPVRYVAGNKTQDDMQEIVTTCAQKNNISVQLLTTESLKLTDTTLFNDRALLTQWVKERTANTFQEKRANIDYLMIDDLIKRHDARYICFINSAGVVMKQQVGAKLLALLIGVFYPPLILYVAMDIATPQTAYILEYSIYDLKTGEIIKDVSKTYDSGDRKDLIKAEIYNVFFQLNKREK